MPTHDMPVRHSVLLHLWQGMADMRVHRRTTRYYQATCLFEQETERRDQETGQLESLESKDPRRETSRDCVVSRPG